MDGIDNLLPVDAYIPGCPPRPEAIIDGVVKLLSSLNSATKSPAATLINQEIGPLLEP